MLQFQIPITIKVSTNKIYSGIHWGKRKKIADEYHKTVSLLCANKGQVAEYPVEIRYDFQFKSRPLDTLNCTFMAKCIEDGLRRIGVLEDDDWKHVTSSSLTTRKGAEDSLVITISKHSNS